LAPFGQAVSEEKIFLTLANQKQELPLVAIFENVIYGSNIFLNYLQKLINVSFANGHIPDSLKIGTLFPVFKNKGDIKSAKNY
jgi:hypothetical protein